MDWDVFGAWVTVIGIGVLLIILFRKQIGLIWKRLLFLIRWYLGS